MTHPVRMTPEAAAARLWEIAHTLDELSLQQSRLHEGEEGLASTLMLLYRNLEDCASALYPLHPSVPDSSSS
ncbi:conserved protein of unknown function [Pseudodesulfovibrio profundus]|uniref:Uncharacterized protein n=1 Tax=Pseudodesulfovibrio profundus TaxID=57320 RepID=A0A2C8FDJ3_9BACT|nr:hypothetical protein [Pseudodesulfovibrio profundus]SOB60531.1 conserved protein of unknown function [Pseudodesulfovibrio profundus]